MLMEAAESRNTLELKRSEMLKMALHKGFRQDQFEVRAFCCWCCWGAPHADNIVRCAVVQACLDEYKDLGVFAGDADEDRIAIVGGQ